MKEKMIDIYDNKGIIISLIKKGNNYVIEKCLVSNNTINLNYIFEFKSLKDAKVKLNELKPY